MRCYGEKMDIIPMIKKGVAHPEKRGVASEVTSWTQQMVMESSPCTSRMEAAIIRVVSTTFDGNGL